jgi:hypothetical protein
VDVGQAKGKFGPLLQIDIKTERFISPNAGLAEKANAMLSREYRKGFELKEIV